MRRTWIALGWAMIGAVIWLSLTPSPPKVDFEQSDKVGHLLAYGCLMFWFSQLYTGLPRIGYAAGFAGMGIALEFAQGTLGYRSYELVDMGANGLGVLLGWAAALILPTALPGARGHTR